MSRDHRGLEAFKLTDELVLSVYAATRSFPKEELFGLTAQLRRAAVSAAANIVEGCARDTERDYVRFLHMAFGSLRETGYHVSLAARLGNLAQETADALDEKYNHAARVLSGLIRVREQDLT